MNPKFQRFFELENCWDSLNFLWQFLKFLQPKKLRSVLENVCSSQATLCHLEQENPHRKRSFISKLSARLKRFVCGKFKIQLEEFSFVYSNRSFTMDVFSTAFNKQPLRERSEKGWNFSMRKNHLFNDIRDEMRFFLFIPFCHWILCLPELLWRKTW
jgi:hypothetical protein